MTRRKAIKVAKLLDDHIDRYELIGLDSGGVALTVYWLTGGQTLYYDYDIGQCQTRTIDDLID